MAAPREVVPMVMDLVKPNSVLDVGCGIGTWLKAFEEKGIDDCLGIDGDYVDRSLFRIPEEKFQTVDLRNGWALKRKFDLAISLEVAEHLPESSADLFVESLINHGTTILFSAAIPGQGGQNHLNEQWPEYWQEKFLKHGFYFHDTIRPLIWNNSKVDWWYKQNVFLVKREKPSSLPYQSLSVIHPEFFLKTWNDGNDLKRSIVTGRQGIALSSKIFFNALMYKLTSIYKK
jgi:SAM-dependent methyltransferase